MNPEKTLGWWLFIIFSCVNYYINSSHFSNTSHVLKVCVCVCVCVHMMVNLVFFFSFFPLGRFLFVSSYPSSFSTFLTKKQNAPLHGISYGGHRCATRKCDEYFLQIGEGFFEVLLSFFFSLLLKLISSFPFRLFCFLSFSHPLLLGRWMINQSNNTIFRS